LGLFLLTHVPVFFPLCFKRVFSLLVFLADPPVDR
jgi:hypothetical protein